jgi:hypothetical protein
MTMDKTTKSIFDGEEGTCQCGREKARNHCPRGDCIGSTMVYAKAKDSFKYKDAAGDTIRIMVYRCRSCGRDYNDLDRLDCKAPAKRLPSRKLNPTNNLSPDERLSLLRTMFPGEKK